MRHNPETYALIDTRDLLTDGLSMIIDPGDSYFTTAHNGLVSVRDAFFVFENVILPLEEKLPYYQTELGKLVIHEDEFALFRTFADLFAEIYFSTLSPRPVNLRMVKHPRWEEFKEIVGQLLNMMHMGSIIHPRWGPVSAFSVNVDSEAPDPDEAHKILLREIVALYDSDRYPIWYSDSDDEPTTFQDFKDWFLETGKADLFNRYSFSQDESHSVVVGKSNHATEPFSFSIPTEDIPKVRKLMLKCEGLFDTFSEFPGSRDAGRIEYSKFHEALKRRPLVGYRDTLRPLLSILTNSKLNERWKEKVSYDSLQSVIGLLAELFLPWEDKRGRFFDLVNGEIAVRDRTQVYFERFGQFLAEIRTAVEEQNRFEFAMVQDVRWIELLEVAKVINISLNSLNVKKLEFDLPSFKVEILFEDGYDYSGRSQNFLTVLEQVLCLYSKEEYRYWHSRSKVFGYPILSKEELLEELLGNRPCPDSHYSAFSEDDTHLVGIELEEQDGIIGFSLPNSLLHQIDSFLESIAGSYKVLRRDDAH